MSVVTTRFRPKAFSWSFSKLKNFTTCPKRYYHVDVKRDVKEEEGEALLWGNHVHDSLAKHLDKGEPLPEGMQFYAKWTEKLLTSPGKMLVEQKLAINKDFGPCDWKSNEAWFRGIGDVIKINGRAALVLDWKTGKILEESQQLALMAACVFAHHPEVEAVKSAFIWLKEDAETVGLYRRSEMHKEWSVILPRVAELQRAHEAQEFPPKPSNLCKRWCPVSSCPHHGS